MTSVSVRELSHHTSRYLARVKSGQSLEIIEHGRVIAVITPADLSDRQRPRPKVGGYHSKSPLTAEEIDAELDRGFGDDDRRRGATSWDA
jgi:prevent-host-death family protein